jgi:phenylacetic acid degradation operon negative regulatory protein
VATRRNIGADVTLLERPLTARSLVLSLLLGRHPPSAPVALLVRWCALFGVSGTAARVALSRMVERGEVSAHDAVYELTGRLRRRQEAQEFALAPLTASWDGCWTLAVVTGTERSAADRAALRAAMAQVRRAELREGVWCRPDNLPSSASPPDASAVVAAQCATWRGAVPDESPHDVATRLFAPAAWGDRGRALLERLTEVTERLDDESITDGFVVGAAAAQHLRRDPLLPDDLLPARWPGDELRAAYAAYVARFGDVVAAWAERTL